jgi:hypothetical protein
VITLRPTRYLLQVSGDGRSWRTVAAVARRTGTVDTVHFKAVRLRFVRVRILSGGTPVPMPNPKGSGIVTGVELPMLDELTVSG